MPFEPSVQIPIHPDATAPAQYVLGLHFLEEYKEGLLSYIQDVRARAIQSRQVRFGRETASAALNFERRYWENLEDSCDRLVEQVRDSDFDLIVDPPSNTGYHRPYLSALQRAYPHAAYCYLLKNSPGLESGPGEIRFTDLDHGTEFRFRTDDNLLERKSILIVDDILSKGLTAAVVVHKVRPHVHPEARFTLACPLRLPSEKETENLQAMIEEMGQKSGRVQPSGPEEPGDSPA